mmetsp:Transcript_4576/g.15003  ORF Transcript_4576/g.15003 Transcript_4576/m.15003 type:complete len:93 (-) Transcript_4576:372-650(-)
MASGFGTRQPVGRCYPVYREFADCVVAKGGTSECGELREDYLECLHHKKEINRLNALSAERNRKLKEGEQVPTTLHEDQKAGNLHLPFTNIK